MCIRDSIYRPESSEGHDDSSALSGYTKVDLVDGQMCIRDSVIDDPDYEVEDGDFVTVRMTIMNDGAVIPGLNDVERMISIGGGSMPETFDEHVIGTKKGYTLDFDFDAKGQDDRPELGDGNLHANV